MAEEYEMGDEEYDINEGSDAEGMQHSESDDGFVDFNGKVTDTTAAQAREGKDIQGICWDLINMTRSEYRLARNGHYIEHGDIPNSRQASKMECTPTEVGGHYYEFHYNATSVKLTNPHYLREGSTFTSRSRSQERNDDRREVAEFLIRNLLWATSKHDVYLLSHNTVLHWSAITMDKHDIVHFCGHLVPSERHPEGLLEGLSHTAVCTFAVKDKLLVAGGVSGELVCKYLDREGISFCYRTTTDGDNAITKAVEIYDSTSGALHFITSSDDGGVREFDAEKFELFQHLQFDWPVNHAAASPDGNLIVVVGNNPGGVLVDSVTGKSIHALQGHKDYSYASAWHPSGLTLATGNQDATCRLWDIRNLSRSLHVIRSMLGAVRSIRFTSDGRFMAAAESADVVRIFDVQSGYKWQIIDLFGEISGISFSPDTEALYIGVWDDDNFSYCNLLQYRRRHKFSYLDSIF